MRFAVFTHVRHVKFNNQYYAYSPYVHEMNIWFSQNKNIELVAPLMEGLPTDISIPYKAARINFNEIPSFDLLNCKGIFNSIIKVPWIFFKIIHIMNKSDHLHIRCPGNVGLIACVAQIFFPNKPKTAKYAGNWDPKAKQPLSYRIQKRILSNTFFTKNMKVLVYGKWSNSSKNILPFFTASFYRSEIPKTIIIKPKNIKFLFVGTFSEGKRPILAIQIFQYVLKNGHTATLEIYGSGKLEYQLKDYIKQHQLESVVKIIGNVKRSELKEVYNYSHFLILPSLSEGWPKVVAEAMFFGCIPITTGVSCVPWMLGKKERGILISDDLYFTSKQISGIINDENLFNLMSNSARKWSQQFTLNRFENEVKRLL